jgi:hypothetical protein
MSLSGIYRIGLYHSNISRTKRMKGVRDDCAKWTYIYHKEYKTNNDEYCLSNSDLLEFPIKLL